LLSNIQERGPKIDDWIKPQGSKENGKEFATNPGGDVLPLESIALRKATDASVHLNLSVTILSKRCSSLESY
jgi:hypothetical protein